MADVGIELRGVPKSVRGFLHVAHHEIRALPELVLDGIAHDERLVVQTVPRATLTELRVALPNLTKPGEYRGRLRIGERHYGVVAHVEPSLHLACVPQRIELTYGPNRRLRETLTIVNDGNVTAAIEKHYGFGLFESTGVDRAIRSAFEQHGTTQRSVVDAFSDAAADEYGGVAAASVAEGAGPLHPGEMRSVALSFRLSEKARHGGSYFGYLSIANLTIPVSVRNAEHAATEVAS